MRSCICGVDREMLIPKLAREWRAGSANSSAASSPTYANSSGDAASSSHSPPSSIDLSTPTDETDLLHEAFNERARKSLGIPNKPKPQDHTQFYAFQAPVFVETESLAYWAGKLDGVEDGLLNALSFADSWYQGPGSSGLVGHESSPPPQQQHAANFVPQLQTDISLGSMSAQEEARRQIEAYCRR